MGRGIKGDVCKRCSTAKLVTLRLLNEINNLFGNAQLSPYSVEFHFSAPQRVRILAPTRPSV